MANMTPMHRALLQEEYFFRVDSFLAILEAYPDAAKIPDVHGTYPLHNAIAQYCGRAKGTLQKKVVVALQITMFSCPTRNNNHNHRHNTIPAEETML
jgi:hypothetical protein